MKKVFEIKTDEKNPPMISNKLTFNVFADDICEASNKVLSCSEKNMQVVEAKLLCIVEEDSDLKEYGEEIDENTN